MIPLKDDNPTDNKPIVTYWLIGICVFVFIVELSSVSYRTGAFFYSFGLIPSVLLGHTQSVSYTHLTLPTTPYV